MPYQYTRGRYDHPDGRYASDCAGVYGGWQVDRAQPGTARNNLDQAISQANELTKEYLDDDIVALTSARSGQGDHAQQNGAHGLLEDEGHNRQIDGGISWMD